MPELKVSHLKKYIDMTDGVVKYTRAYRWLDILYESMKIKKS